MIIAAAVVVLLVLAGLAVGRADHPRQLLRHRARRHGLDHARDPGLDTGHPLQEPYLLGCLNDRNELSQISYGQKP